MKKMLILLKNSFVTSLGINKILKSKKSKIILYGLFILYLIFSLLMVSYGYATTMFDYLRRFNLINFMLTMAFITGSFSIFMFSIYNSKSNLFNAKDNDLLLSMPIKQSTILASRLINMLVWNLVTSIFIVGPALAVYAVNMNPQNDYYLFVILIFVLLPIIPSILASLIGYVIAYFTSKSNAKNWFEIIMSFLFIFGIYYLMGNAEKILSFFVKDIHQLENVLKWGFYPIYLVNKALNNYNYLSLLIYVIINIGLFIIFVILLSKNFKTIISKLQETKAKANYVMKTLKIKTVGKALLNKELKRYFASPIYVLNTSFGVILILALAIGSIFIDQNQLLTLLGFSTENVTIFQLLVMAIAFVTLISNTASASISLEGNNFWILKSLPINFQKIINSKILLNLLIVLPITYLAIIILKFTLALSIIEMLLLILIATICSIMIAEFGLLMNLKFPLMDAVSDVVIVKRSASVMISIFVPMIIIFAISGVYSELSSQINFNILLIVAIIIMILFTIIERLILNTWGVKKIKQIG